MADHGQHCPFLNRTETRCSTNFSLDRLGHAFAHCFGQYETCPVYAELLGERRQRLGCGGCGGDCDDTDAFQPVIRVRIGQSMRQQAA